MSVKPPPRQRGWNAPDFGIDFHNPAADVGLEHFPIKRRNVQRVRVRDFRTLASFALSPSASLWLQCFTRDAVRWWGGHAPDQLINACRRTIKASSILYAQIVATLLGGRCVAFGGNE